MQTPDEPTLPTNLDAEMAVIGSILLDRDAVIYADRIIDADHLDAFYHPTHRAIYTAMVELYQQRIPSDLITVTDALKSADQAAAAADLMAYTFAVPTGAHVEYYARIVLRHYAKRLMIEAGRMIAELGHSAEDIAAIQDKARAALDRAMLRNQTSNIVTMEQAGTAFLAQLERGGDRGASTGYRSLDRMLGGGLHNADLILLAALTSGGKTALACQMSLNFAKRAEPVLYVSLEMKSLALMARLVAIHSGVPLDQIRQPDMMHAGDLQKTVESTGAIMQMPLLIDDDFSATLSNVRSRALALHAEHDGLAMVVVDYIGQLSTPGVSEENRTREVSKFSRGLKSLAGELNCPVLALAQFNRQASNRPGEVPRLSDLKETSSLEQDADVVLIGHRPELYDANAPRGVYEVHIAKQRQGPLGKVALSYDQTTGRFDEMTYRSPQGY